MAEEKIDQALLKMDKLINKVNLTENCIKMFNDRISSVKQAINSTKTEVNEMKRVKASTQTTMLCRAHAGFEWFKIFMPIVPFLK